MSSLNIKKGDLVVVIAGSDKGKKAKVISTSPKSKKVTVEGVNVQKRHKKPRSAKAAGGITSVAGPIDVSNVQPVCQNSKCEKSGEGVRVKHVLGKDGRSIRVCCKCGESLEKAAVKEVKKAKKDTKAKDTDAPVKEAKAKEEKAPAKAKAAKETKSKEEKAEKAAEKKPRAAKEKTAAESGDK